MTCKILPSFVQIVEQTDFSLIETFVNRSKSWWSEVNAPFLIKNTVIEPIGINVLTIKSIQFFVIAFYPLWAQKVVVRRMSDNVCFNFLIKEFFEFGSYFFVKVQVWYFEDFEEFVLDANTDLLCWRIFIESRFSLDKMLWSNVIPAKNEHEGNHMRKKTGIFDDLLGMGENGLFGLNKQKPCKRGKNVFIVWVEIDWFELKFGDYFLELVREGDE